MGGDEFMILLTDLTREDNALEIARKIVESFQKAFDFNSHHLAITASIGVALFPLDGEDADTLIRNADIAMYKIKESGRNNYTRYSAHMNVSDSAS